MSIFAAILGGFGRTLGAPVVLLRLWLANLVVALPVAWVLNASLQKSFGNSPVHENMREGFDSGWFGEYQAAARGIETTFTPTHSGAGGFYQNLEGWVTGNLFEGFPGLVGLGILYGLIWALLLGGVVDLFVHRNAGRSPARFIQAGGRYFFRFVRLAALSGVLYFLVYRLHHWLFGWLEEATRDVTSERTVLWFSLVGYGLTAFLLAFVNNSFGYAKVATVAEDRRSMVLAAVRGIGFVVSHPVRTIGLYLAMVLLGAAALALYSVVAPGAGQASWVGVIVAFVVAQLFLVLKLVLRLALLGGQTALYQGSDDVAALSSSVNRGR